MPQPSDHHEHRFDPTTLRAELLRHLSVMERIATHLTIVAVPDHIGFRCESMASYEKKRPELLRVGRIVREIHVADRRIGVFELNGPVCGMRAFALQEARSDEEAWEGVEHVGHVTPSLVEAHRLLSDAEGIRTMPVKLVSLARYFKFFAEGIELELRDRPILDQ